MPPPPRPSGGVARGPEAPPHPPPPPTQAQKRTEADRRNGGPTPPPKRPSTRGAGAPRPRQAPTRSACCRPTAGRRRPERRKQSGLIGGRPGEDGGANQGGGVPPPPPPPPAALTRRRPTGPRPTPAAARQPPRHEYTAGGHARGNGRQADARRGRGAGRPPPHPPPPPHPCQLGSHRSGPPPPRSRGDAPPDRRDRDAGGGNCGWTCSRWGHGRGASPHQRAGATRAAEQYGGRAPHDPPVTRAHSGRAEGGFRSAGAPEGAVHGPLLTPPIPGRHCDPDRTRTPEGSAPTTRGGPGLSTAGRHPEGEQGGRGATPPPPPHRPASRGGPGPQPPRQGGWSPPARERSWSATRPPARAAGSHGGRGEQASPRQRARTPHRSRPEKAGEHEPEWYGGPRPPWTARRQ